MKTKTTKRSAMARNGALLGMLALAAGNAQAQNNQATGFRSFIGGGQNNTASNFASSILGGVENTASGQNANVLGGQLNEAIGSRSGIFTGYDNTVTGTANNGSILTGAFNTVSGNSSAILSGSNNTASGQSSLVLTGKDNTVSSSGSVVGGDNSNLGSSDSFLWGSDIDTIGSSGIVYLADSSRAGTRLIDDVDSNSFVGRFDNGFQFLTDPTGSGEGLTVAGDGTKTTQRSLGGFSNAFFEVANTGDTWQIGMTSSDGDFRLVDTSTSVPYLVLEDGESTIGLLGSDNAGNAITVGTDTNTGNGARLTRSGVWTDASSRTFKENFKDLNSAEILEKVVSLPMTSWNYKGESDVLHIGPIAEDFHATFGLGEDEKYLATLDSAGVALVAIQALNQKVEEKDAEIEALNERLEKLESMIKASTE